MNKNDIAQRFGNSASTYNSASTAQLQAATSLVQRLAIHTPIGGTVFEVGCGTGHLTRLMMSHVKPHFYYANDISSSMLQQLRNDNSDNYLSTLEGDAESIAWPTDMDMVVSASAVQWFDNPLSFIHKAHNALKPGGIMGLATYGPQTFHELQSLGVKGLHYPDISEWNDTILQTGMSILSTDVSCLTLHYPNSLEVMRDLQRAGVTSSDSPLTAGSMRSLLRQYDLLSTNGMVPLTYEIYMLIASKQSHSTTH